MVTLLYVYAAVLGGLALLLIFAPLDDKDGEQ